MIRRDTRGVRKPIEEVLERIDAQPLPDADELARMSVSEIERQLADLGVDTDAELGELLGQVELPTMEPLARLSVSDVEKLSIAQVERRLEAEGVDVRAWLSRAETLIRNARVRATSDESRASLARAPSAGLHAGAHRPALPRSSGRQRRRVPQALAASIVMVAIAGVTLSILNEPELNVGSPGFSEEMLASAPAESESAALQEKLRKREGTQLAQVPQKQSPEQSASKRGAFTRDLRKPGQPSAESRRDAMQDTLAAVADAPLSSVDEPRPAPAMFPSTASASPPAATASEKAIVSANAVAQHKAKTQSVAKLLAPNIALPAPIPSQESPQESLQASPKKYRTTPSRVDDAVARVQSEPQPGAPDPRAGVALRTEKKMFEAVTSSGVARQQRLNANTANEPDKALTTVHALRAGQTLAVSLAGLPLREADRKALVQVFADVDVSSGASLRLSIDHGLVQTADLQLLQGRSITAIRNSRGELVLER